MNIPLIEALEKMLDYTKFMKDVVTKKRTVSYELMYILHHYSAIATRSLVQKKSNTGAFTIPCMIESFIFAKSLYDLRANINLMPLEIYQ